MNRLLIPTVVLALVASLGIGSAYAYFGYYSEPVPEFDVHSDFGTAEIFSDAEGTHPVNSVAFSENTVSFYVRYTDKDSQISSAAVSVTLGNLDPSTNGSIISMSFGGNSYSGKVFTTDGVYKCTINGFTIPLSDGHTSVIPVSITVSSDPGNPSIGIRFSHFTN